MFAWFSDGLYSTGFAAELFFSTQSRFLGQLRVITQLRVCVQRQVVARHIDLVLQQGFNACFFQPVIVTGSLFQNIPW